MQNIKIETITDGNIELCRDLCDELMAFQKSKALINLELFDAMNFDTRMKPSFDAALQKNVIIVTDNGIPVGYVFSTINIVTNVEKNFMPSWAPKDKSSLGFYPEWVLLPQKIGCLNNLYIRDSYKGMGIGKELTSRAMKWLGSFADCKIVFVYISNGNDAAYNFYIKNGFTYSHEVFGGFIKAAYYKFN